MLNKNSNILETDSRFSARIHVWYMGIYKKPRPFNHIFGGDWILRAWYRGIKNAGPRKRAQGRAQDIPYQSIPPYHHGIWRIFIECGKNPTRARARKGEAQGVLSYQQATGIFDNPHILTRIWFDFLSQMKAKKKNYIANDKYLEHVFEKFPRYHIFEVSTLRTLYLEHLWFNQLSRIKRNTQPVNKHLVFVFGGPQ